MMSQADLPGKTPDPLTGPLSSAPPTSHPRALWFFFWGEFAERASYYGMRAILPLYLTSIMAFSDKDGGTIYYYFKMSAYFLPLIGGIVADRWLGRYWTIVGFSIPYVLGHFTLGVSDHAFLGVSGRAWLFLSLFLLAGGTGVIKPNISSLLGQTYDEQRPGQDGLRNAGFQIFYFAINIGALISMFALPFIRDSKGYAIAFQFPAWLMVIALGIFAGGKKLYAKDVIATHVPKTPEQKKEQWATLMRLSGVFGLIVLWWVAYEQNDSVWVFFARDYMNHKFHVPDWLPGWLGGGQDYDPKADSYQYINSLFVILLIPTFTVIFTKIDPAMKFITPMRKILAGFLLTAVAFASLMFAAWLTNNGTTKVTSLWLVWAYIVLTAGEVLLYGTMLDVSYAEAPKSMKGFVTGCFLMTNAISNFINSFLARLYGGSLKDAPEDRGPMSPFSFFAMDLAILLVAAVAFYFVGKRFERSSAAANNKSA